MKDHFTHSPFTNKLDWSTTTFKGVSAAAPATASSGDYYINSGDNSLYMYYSGAWIMIMTLTAAGAYVLKAGDTMTGDLTLPALHATDSGESVFNDDVRFNSNIILKSGQKLIFDGD